MLNLCDYCHTYLAIIYEMSFRPSVVRITLTHSECKNFPHKNKKIKNKIYVTFSPNKAPHLA